MLGTYPRCTYLSKASLNMNNFAGETERLIELLLEGYDHLLDIDDDNDQNIVDIVSSKQENRTLAFLRSIPAFEVGTKIIVLFLCSTYSTDLTVKRSETKWREHFLKLFGI